MSCKNNNFNHYAILIGIDDYPYKPLRSAVRDVEDMKLHLESTLRDAVHIQILAESQTNQELCDQAKDLMARPTHDGVICAFKTVISRAQAGDFVYVHFSGHGTRKPPCGEFSDRTTGDLALVLLSHEERRVRYLWGFEMASYIKTMVDSGLVVTLVLDCCFSASVYRQEGSDVRFLPYDAETDSKYPSDPERLADKYPICRDTSMQPNWLTNPDRYAILAACGPQEGAVEPKFDGQHHGAFSYFLLRILQRSRAYAPEECDGMPCVTMFVPRDTNFKFIRIIRRERTQLKYFGVLPELSLEIPPKGEGWHSKGGASRDKGAVQATQGSAGGWPQRQVAAAPGPPRTAPLGEARVGGLM
ncbi:hypothetical protein Purlil1_12546 [Purpureocillium lilacinum]|uniref:Peptidase C14 caspase domain-containing protein n=1 Tax=Purpureocillium lilacinum TaxID=33203 RepID=A0ABR0BH68_PURLI|nr:hypothetical protein Purlil1_12546 [Purpureocillium lilacinum]